MSQITLKIMTRELCHEFYKGYKNDPALYMDMSVYSDYIYNINKVDEYYEGQQVVTRIVFTVLLDNKPIGEIKLKYIDYDKKECTLGIVLQNDKVKGKGYGSYAERLAIQYAFDKLGMKVVLADAVLKNERSQHVLEKVGFQYICKDDTFIYYKLEESSYIGDKIY